MDALSRMQPSPDAARHGWVVMPISDPEPRPKENGNAVIKKRPVSATVARLIVRRDQKLGRRKHTAVVRGEARAARARVAFSTDADARREAGQSIAGVENTAGRDLARLPELRVETR